MNLRSGKLVDVAWPRPTDVRPKYYENRKGMSDYFRLLMKTWGSSKTHTLHRLTILEIAETLIANPHLLVEPHPYQKMITDLVQQFEKPEVVITTFDKEAYLCRLRSLF